ncbi:MAG: hypothetical protein J0I07_39700 [Myxococcales bacterium]|nr:hypothetical protein [Myxococcales bacterium]
MRRSVERRLRAVCTAANVASLSGVDAVAGGLAHSCAVLADRSIRCWGRNTSGQLGNPTAGSFNATPHLVLWWGATGSERPHPGPRARAARLRPLGSTST